MQNILDKFFTAEEPEIPVAEQELLGGGSLPPQGPPPGIQQFLQGMRWIMSINKQFADIVHNSLGD